MVVIVTNYKRTRYVHADRLTFDDGKVQLWKNSLLVETVEPDELEAVLS